MEPYNAYSQLEARAEELRQTIADAQKSLEEIDTLKRLVTKYLPAVLDLSPMKKVDPAGLLAAVAHTVMVAKRETKRDQIINAARVILSDGNRHSSRYLVVALEGLGVRIGGDDPAALLSSYLSREKAMFESDLKAGGWALRPASGGVRSDDAATPPDLFINGHTNHPGHAVSVLKEGAELG
jgi:hypothetical protein